MAIDFPSSPSINDTFTASERTWIWDGVAWRGIIASPTSGGPLTPDTHPSVPNAIDDEFEGDLTAFNAKWTRNTSYSFGATPTVSLANGAVKILSNSGQGPHCYGQPISGTCKIRAHVAMHTTAGFANAFTSFQQVGIYVGRSTKRISWHMLSSAVAEVGRWTNTTFNTANAYSSLGTKAELERGIYFEIEYDGTNIHYRISRTGYDGTFYTEASEAAASHLGGEPTECGLMVHPSSATNVFLISDWFRRIS